jgi:heme/copper-type cytochrome/quinol oxidase subunit 3
MTMTDITPYKGIPLDVSEGEPIRPRLLLIGTSLASASVTVGYAGIVGYYLSRRAALRATGDLWIPDNVSIPLTQPNFMMLTLTFSAISMLWALWAVRNDDRANAFIAFALTLVFGFAQIAQTAYLLTLMEMPAAGSEAAALIYAMIGIQLALTGVAMAYVVVMALRTLGGGYSAKDYEGVLSATVFWIMTVGVYATLWYAVYITK